MIDNSEELFPVVDEAGNILGSIKRKEAHNGSMTLHPVVHLHVFDNQGNIYLQKRPEWKDIQPGKWDTACGGHVDLGENVRTALIREAREELNLTDFDIRELGHYVFESTRERELVYVHTTTIDSEIHPNTEELSDGRFWSRKEILANMDNDTFTPNFISEYMKYFNE
ncbi:MAG: NUDIX domain-containing protein [Prevotella sp.]